MEGRLGKALKVCRSNASDVDKVGRLVVYRVDRRGCWCRFTVSGGEARAEVPADASCPARDVAVRCLVYRDPFPRRLADLFIILFLIGLYIVSFASPESSIAFLVGLAVLVSIVPSLVKWSTEWYAGRRSERLAREAVMASSMDPRCRRLLDRIMRELGESGWRG